jgi:tetratricopeptide (TPR) repeat protein
MKRINLFAMAAVCLLAGVGIGWAAKPAGTAVFLGKAPKDAAHAALLEAEQLAGTGSWELIAVGRVYYLSGDKAKGQALFDTATAKKPKPSDWQRIADVYVEAGERDKAEPLYQRVLAENPKDDTGASEIGAWYVRNGQREKGEVLFTQALTRNPDDMWHYVRAAEAYLGVPRGR